MKEKKPVNKKKAIIIYSVIGSILVAGGIGTGILLYQFFGFNGTDYSSINQNSLEMNVDGMMKQYKKANITSLNDATNKFSIPELANIAIYNSEEHESMTIIAKGEVTATMNVKQSIRSYQVKKDNHYFLEQISHSSFVELAWRIYGDSTSTVTTKGSYVDIEEGDFTTNPVNKDYTNDEFENAWGKKLSSSMIYIISDKTVLDTSTFSIEGNNLKLSLDLHPVYSVLKYVKQMVMTSDLSREPSFHNVHLDMEIDKDMVLQKVDVKEVYDVQSFGVTSKNTVGELHEVRYYNLNEDIPEMNTKSNYDKEAL